MKKGMLLIFWGLMFLTLTIVELPWEGLIWGFNMIGYGLCATGMLMTFRVSEIRAFLISGVGLLGAMICCLLSLAASLPLRYSGILMLVCRIFELFGFAKMFEGCWRQFRRRRLREKAKETDLRMKIYMLAFTLCAIAEAACWFIGAAWASQIVQLIIRLVYGMLMACVMLYSESDSLLPREEEARM